MVGVFHLILLLYCLQTVFLQPIHEDAGSSLMGRYEVRLAKRPFYGYNNAFMAPLGMLETPRGSQGQRKKAVDSTFIRFGRSERSLDDPSESLASFDDPRVPQEPSPDFKIEPQRFLVNHNGCRVANSRELMRALMTDPNCIRAFQKDKKENVNDTFIRFGKREAPPEMEFENIHSEEAR